MYKNISLVFFLIINGIGLSQTSSSSPFSSEGFGDTKFYGNAYVMGLGGASTALTDSSQVNTFNPTTYSLLAHHLPLISLGLTHYESQFSSNGNTNKARFTGISHFAIAIPFGGRYGLAFGLKPFSRRGYSINNYELVDQDTIHYLYKGKGSIYDVFLGFSANVIQDLHHTLTLGFNAKYYFGRVMNSRRAYQNSAGDIKAGGMKNSSLHAKSFGVEFGINYNYRPNPENSFRIAAVYRPGINAKFDKTQTRIFYGNFLSQASYDTISHTDPIRGKVYIPQKTSIGLTYIYSPSKSSTEKHNYKHPSFLFTLEYTNEDWGNYKQVFSNKNIASNPFKNSSAYRFGFQYTPHKLTNNRSSYIGFFDRINYRVGAYWVNTPYTNNNHQLKDRGVTLGFGIPILLHQSVSTINLSVNYGTINGGDGPNSIKQRYFGINFGINIAPGFDRWFRKTKLR